MKTKNILIIGAGGFGREIETYALEKYKGSKEWKVVGFLDDNPHAIEDKKSNLKIISSIKEYKFRYNDFIILAIADPNIKKNIVNILSLKNVNFLTFIANNVILGIGVKVGTGSVICPGTIIPNNSSIEDFVTVNINCTIGHDTVIKPFTSLMPSVNIGGEATIGEFVFMGTNSNIAPRINVCKDAFIGMAANVISDITESGTYFGNPVRKMRN